MPSLTLSDRLIWFAHCPKAGGTSVERMMVDLQGAAVGHLFWGWDLWWKGGGWRKADPPCSPQHLTWCDARAALPRPPDAVFATVREPLARMQSEHRWQATRRRGTRAGRLLARLPFPLWLRLMLEIARINPYAFDNHFRPQADFVPEGAVVFRLEDGLGPVAEWLAGQGAGRVAAPPHLLKGGSGTRSADPASRALAARAFAADHARFGYPVPAGLPPAPRTGALLRRIARGLAALERRGRL